MRKSGIYCFGNRIYLGPILEKHLSFITLWLNDSEVNKFLDINIPLVFKEVKESWKTLNSRTKTDIVFSICLHTRDVIGEIGIHCIDLDEKTAVVGLFIGNKKLWNKGYGTEAHILFLEYVFTKLHLLKIFADVDSQNKRSIKSFKKCGYKQEKMDTEEGLKVNFAIRKDDFLPILESYKKGSFE